MKYRRDISSTLTFLALGLGLFLAYQMWIKPTYLVPHPPAEPPTTASPVPSSPSLPLADALIYPSWDVPPSRLVDLGPAPDQTLSSIRDDLDRGNYSKVDRRLRGLSQKKVTKKIARQYIAGLWNNLGVQQEKFGGTALSVNAFKQSVSWNPASPLAHLNLTQAYWELRDPGMTPQFLETVIRLAPQDPFPHLALADLFLSKGNMALASSHLEKARPLAERDRNNRSYLLKLTAKAEAIAPMRTATSGTVQAPRPTHQEIARAPEASQLPLSPSPKPISQPRQPTEAPSPAPPSQMAQPAAAHFSVRFDGPPDQATETRMRAILEYAYQELTQKFGHIPTKSISVVLHTDQKFVTEAGSPQWADTLFDHLSGTIHLPTQGALEDLALFSRIARHEFAHALLHEQMKGTVAGVPTWLMEGLAMQLADDPWSDVEEISQKEGAVVPLTSLQGAWKRLSGDAVHIAYLEARSATQTLVDSYSIYGVRQIMSLLQTGQSLDAAMKQKFSMSYEQFRHQWEQTPRTSMKSSGS